MFSIILCTITQELHTPDLMVRARANTSDTTGRNHLGEQVVGTSRVGRILGLHELGGEPMVTIEPVTVLAESTTAPAGTAHHRLPI